MKILSVLLETIPDLAMRAIETPLSSPMEQCGTSTIQHHPGESLSKAWTRFKDLLQKVPHHGIDLWLQVPIFYDNVNPATRRAIDQSAGAHLAPKSPVQVNKINSLCKIWNGPHDTQYCMENPEQAFVDYASSRTDRAGVCGEFKARKKWVRVQGEMPEKIKYLRLFTMPSKLGNSKPFDTLADLGSCVNLIPLYLFKKLKIRLVEEIDHVFGLADETKSYPVGFVKNVEVHIGRLKLLDNFDVIDMDKDHAIPLLVGRGFLATSNAVIDYRKAKIAVGEGVTRSIFRVKEINLGDEEIPYWTTLERLYGTPFALGWQLARNVVLNPFKDVLVFRKMIEFLGAIPINLKGNMWESEELIKKNKIDWIRPLKEGDGAWHIRIELIDLDEEKFKKTFQSIPTTRKLSEKENPSEIIDLDHLHGF
ncbi:MAK10-like protein [Tanacetum coccineum]